MTDEVKMKYPGNEIDGFQAGAILDLRVRMAVDFIKSPAFHHVVADWDTENIARNALELADEVLSQAEARGWVKPIEDDHPLSDRVKNHGQRTGGFQVHQQLGANKEAADQQSRVVPAAPAIKRDMH